MINHTSTLFPYATLFRSGTSVSDQVEAYAGTSVSGPASGDSNSNGVLDVGETWVYKTSYTLTQARKDRHLNYSDRSMANDATATNNKGGSHSASASVPLT